MRLVQVPTPCLISQTQAPNTKGAAKFISLPLILTTDPAIYCHTDRY